jgi:hypothetical protein
MNITAVVLSKGPYTREWPGLEVHVHRANIRSVADQQEARYQAALQVRTKHWFWLDDDDDLPADYPSVLESCRGFGSPLVYTDELIRSDATGDVTSCNGEYSRSAHLTNPMKVHHMALYQTDISHDAIRALPRGHYWPELPLAWTVAKRGASYLPRVGYIWNRSEGHGMHAWPATQCGRMRARLWCKANP